MDLLEYAAKRKRDFDLQAAKETAQGRKVALLSLLENRHVGKELAITADILASMFGDSTDRPTRLAIQALRNSGHLILSSSHGEYKGYFMAATLNEYEEFRHQNFRARAMSILVTDKEMAHEARKKFGESVQLDLFEEQL